MNFAKKTIHVEEFYKETSAFMPKGISKEIVHFNVFKVEDIVAKYKVKPFMPYNRRAYYKISFIDGRNKAEYADKVIDIEKYALLFATPKSSLSLPAERRKAIRLLLHIY